ncbi:MAG: hypothetical protein NTW55_05655 [Planctomycetota bacterium]|nr:hypothetical protein [Planctomycetota bacterium]
MNRKALYKYIESGGIFAIETDAKGNVISTYGSLLTKDLDPKELDYDNHFTDEIKEKIEKFVL